jgi:hypothetical protein
MHLTLDPAPTEIDADEHLTRDEYARTLRISPRTAVDWEHKGIGPRPIRVSPRIVIYSKRETLAETFKAPPAPRASANTAPQRPAPVVTWPAARAGVEADRRRIRMILARAPKGFESLALRAIKSGLTLEAFDGSLPGELRALMTPLHAFIADFDRPNDSGEVAAQSMIAARNAALGQK